MPSEKGKDNGMIRKTLHRQGKTHLNGIANTGGAAVEIHVIEPRYENPGTEEILLYPKYIARVRLDFKRFGLKPRAFRVVVLVDACTGKVERADVVPNTVLFQSETMNVIPPDIDDKKAMQLLKTYALRRFGRRFLTYWTPEVSFEYLKLVYKSFWIISADKNKTKLLDSLTGSWLTLGGAVKK
ncbi:MAG: hypothetical protein SCJ97_11375 [Bacillota bacterium]|nr:hypothetical protein [Bacillota bacterium]